MKIFLLLLTLATTALAQTAPQEASKSLTHALLNKDAATVKSLLADNISIIWSDGKLYDRADLLDLAQQGAIQEYTPYNIRLVPVDNNSAIVTYDCIIQMPEGDTGLAPRYQHVSELWLKQGETRKLVFLQFTADRPVD